MKAIAFLFAAAILSVVSAQSALSEEGWVVEWDGKHLTVYASDAPLRALLDEVERTAGVTIHGDVGGRVTVDIRALPLRSALEVILSSANVGYGFVEFTKAGETEPSLDVALGKRGTAMPSAAPHAAPRILPEEERMQRQLTVSQPPSAKASAPPIAADGPSDLHQLKGRDQPEVTVILDDIPFNPRAVPAATH